MQHSSYFSKWSGFTSQLYEVPHYHTNLQVPNTRGGDFIRYPGRASLAPVSRSHDVNTSSGRIDFPLSIGREFRLQKIKLRRMTTEYFPYDIDVPTMLLPHRITIYGGWVIP